MVRFILADYALLYKSKFSLQKVATDYPKK